MTATYLANRTYNSLVRALLNPNADPFTGDRKLTADHVKLALAAADIWPKRVEADAHREE